MNEVRMQIYPLPADEEAVRRYVEELWLPYRRELATTVDDHVLAADVDLVAEEVEHRLDLLDDESHRAWIAIDSHGETASTREVLTGTTDDFAGFVTTDVDEAPSVFDRPDRLAVGDIYVREPHRGSGLARDLVDRAVERAHETECREVTLDVDVDNDRAIAFYEKLGFETTRRRMTVSVDDV